MPCDFICIKFEEWTHTCCYKITTNWILQSKVFIWIQIAELIFWLIEICLVPMASSMFSSDQLRSTKISVPCLQSSMVVGMSWSGAAWVLQVLESYISSRETWTTTCTAKYCSRAWSPPSRNWVAGQCSSMTITPNTPPRRPLFY